MRLDDSYCTVNQLKEDNHHVIEGYRQTGEQIIIIKDYYEKIISELLD